jgi:hypothetical protein
VSQQRPTTRTTTTPGGDATAPVPDRLGEILARLASGEDALVAAWARKLAEGERALVPPAVPKPTAT